MLFQGWNPRDLEPVLCFSTVQSKENWCYAGLKSLEKDVRTSYIREYGAGLLCSTKTFRVFELKEKLIINKKQWRRISLLMQKEKKKRYRYLRLWVLDHEYQCNTRIFIYFYQICKIKSLFIFWHMNALVSRTYPPVLAFYRNEDNWGFCLKNNHVVLVRRCKYWAELTHIFDLLLSLKEPTCIHGFLSNSFCLQQPSKARMGVLTCCVLEKTRASFIQISSAFINAA